MAASEPTEFARRSFIYRRLAAAGATFEAIGEAAVAMDFGDAPGEAERGSKLGLADLSPLPRTGFKGLAALSWLSAQGVTGLTVDNRADIQTGGALAARLAPSEALIIDGLSGKTGLCAGLDAAHATEGPAGCHWVMRREASFDFVLTGSEAPEIMAKLCGVDLRTIAFPASAVAQTSVARVSMIIISITLGATPGFHLLGDSASTGYAWDAIIDAMAEFDGVPIGLSALHMLAS